MPDPQAAVRAAIEVAESGLAAGEMPIGAVVFLGEEIIAQAHTSEARLRRRIVHADLLALQGADVRLGFSPRPAPLTLAVTLEPCLMCLGAAITAQVDQVFFGLESPNDGGVDLLDSWKPPVEQSFFRRPALIRGGLHRDEIRNQFARFAVTDAPAGMRAWARELAGTGT